MRVEHYRLLATDIWDTKVVDGFPAPNMNLQLVSKDKGADNYGGFGIYSISYNEPNHGDRLVYLGKFAGQSSTATGIDLASKGDVRQRWFKHIGTATLLLRNLKMGSKRCYRDQKEAALQYFHGNENFNRVYPTSFLGIPDSTLATSVFLNGADMQVSNNRLGFAIQNLTGTNRNRPNTMEELTEVISRFTCHYWRVTSKNDFRKSEINQMLTGTRKEPGVESKLIEIYAQRLPMNNQYIPNALAKGKFFHYDPSQLILTESPEYETYSSRIQELLMESFG